MGINGFNKKINQSISLYECQDLKGEGGKSVFSPNKDLGTRVGDYLGTGKNFPSGENKINNYVEIMSKIFFLLEEE